MKGVCSHPDADYTLSDIDSIDLMELIDDGADDQEKSVG